MAYCCMAMTNPHLFALSWLSWGESLAVKIGWAPADLSKLRGSSWRSAPESCWVQGASKSANRCQQMLKKIKGVRQRNVHIVAYSRCRSVLSPEQVEAGGTCTFLSSCLKCLKRYDIPTVFYTSFAPKSWVINPVTPLEISRIPLKALFGRRPSGAFGRWSWATPGAEGQAHLASS